MTKVMKSIVVLFVLLASQFAYAELPSSVNIELEKIGLSANNVSVYVQALAEQPAQLNRPLIAHQATVSLNPASSMKLLTSYAGLALLGPAYRWKTEVYADGSLTNGVLDGNLYLKGYGDPNLTTADFWRLLSNLRQQGVKQIKGDLIIDDSYFSSQAESAGSFDGEATRAYNAIPNAMTINGKTTSFRFDADANQVRVTLEPNLPEVKVNNLLKLGNADCAAWRGALRYDIKQEGDGATVTFSGAYPANCSEKYLELLVLDELNYNLSLFRKLWIGLGGSFNGKLRVQDVPSNAFKLMQQDSETLAQTLIDINKWSNNLMARQLLLTIAAEKVGLPGTEDNGTLAINRWLASMGLNFNELVIENGSGLSRVERISAEHMGALLVHAYYSPVMPELMASLPVLAVDGTMLKRMKDSDAQGKAHLKTGSINGVFSLAGYMLGQNGQRYVVIFMVNNAKAPLTKPAQNMLLEWVYKQ